MAQRSRSNPGSLRHYALALVLVVAMCVDGGTIYLTKAELDKAADAAVLTAVRNLYPRTNSGVHPGASRILGQLPRRRPLNEHACASITFATNSNNNTTVSILATATFNTYFMRIIPRFQTFQSQFRGHRHARQAHYCVHTQPGRDPQNNGGATALPSAVNTFISYFGDTMDKVSLVSFASTTT